MKTRLVLITAALAGLLLAACTRSATTETVPTQAASGQSAGEGQPSGDPTMDALGTQLASTQAAQQSGGAESPAGSTPEVPSVASATPTQLSAVVATATPIPATATSVPPTATPAACASPYTVKAGEWIYKIARDCKLDPQAIIAANPGINPNRLTPGQKLNLPGAAQPTAAPGATAAPTAQACKGAYTVKAGDNLFRIAYNCGFTTEQLARLNNIAAPYRIFPGQVIKYP